MLALFRNMGAFIHAIPLFFIIYTPNGLGSLGPGFFNYTIIKTMKLYLDWLRKHSIDEFSLPQIDYKDLPAFIHFIDSYILQNNSLRRDYLYLGGKNSYAEQLLLDEGKRARFAFLYEKNKRRLQGF